MCESANEPLFHMLVLWRKRAAGKKIIAKGGKDEVAICSECVVLCVGALINISTTIQFTPNENAPLDARKSGG